MPYTVELKPQAASQYMAWLEEEPRVAAKIDKLLEALGQDPFIPFLIQNCLHAILNWSAAARRDSPCLPKCFAFRARPPCRAFQFRIELPHILSGIGISGIGKPKHLNGFWSRRITKEHRLVYRVEGNQVFVLRCYGHYGNL